MYLNVLVVNANHILVIAGSFSSNYENGHNKISFITAMTLSIVLLTVLAMMIDVTASAKTNSVTELVKFLIALKDVYQPIQLVAYMCLNYSDSIYFARNIPVLLQYNSFDRANLLLPTSDDTPNLTTFLFDLRCPQALKILQKEELKILYRHPYRWILLTKSRDHVPQIEALIDSNILVVDESYELWNFYRIRPQLPYIFEYFGSWNKQQGLTINHTTLIISRRRKDLQGNVLKATLVITQNQSLQHLEDYQEKHIDSIAKANFGVTKILVDSLNATLEYNHASTWGYRDPTTGNWSGMIAELTSGRSDIGGTSLFLQPDRIEVIDYLSMVTPTRIAFIFRSPPLSTTSNIYSLPFTKWVWIASTLWISVAIAMIFSALKIQKYLSVSESSNMPSRFTDIVMMGISAIAQMGLNLQPTTISLRIVVFFLLISLLFLYTSYTANIVALLQSTTKSISTLSDLFHSNLQLGVEDSPYSRYYFPAATEPIRRQIYETKIAKTNAFLNISAGMERVRRGSFAFHVELSAGYELMERTFLEHEKCNLQTIGYLQVSDPWYAIQKNSPFKEILKVHLFRIREHGIQARENAKIYTKQPTCTALGQNFESVRLQECYGAFVILACGFGASIVLLVIEKFWNNARICLI